MRRKNSTWIVKSQGQPRLRQKPEPETPPQPKTRLAAKPQPKPQRGAELRPEAKPRPEAKSQPEPKPKPDVATGAEDLRQKRAEAKKVAAKKAAAKDFELLNRRLALARRTNRLHLAKIILGSGAILSLLVFVALISVLKIRDQADNSKASQLAANKGSGNTIITIRDDSGKLSHLLLISREGQVNMSMYVIPARTVVGIPGGGFERLDQGLSENAQQQLDQAVADLFQIPVQYHMAFTYQTLEGLIEQVGSINFKTGISLSLNKGPGDKGQVTLPPGNNPTGSSLAKALLKSAASDNRDGPRVEAAFYQGLHDALALKPEPDRRALARSFLGRVQTDMGDDEFTDVIMRLISPGGFGVWALPVKTVAESSSPAQASQDWYFEPIVGELQVLMTGSPQDSAYQLEVRNGSEAKGVVENVAARLEQLRFNLSVEPEPSGVNFDVTQIRCGIDALEPCSRVRDVLGRGAIIKDEYLEKKQIIVIIGRDMI